MNNISLPDLFFGRRGFYLVKIVKVAVNRERKGPSSSLVLKAVQYNSKELIYVNYF